MAKIATFFVVYLPYIIRVETVELGTSRQGPAGGGQSVITEPVWANQALRRREFFQEVAKVVTFQLWDG